MRNPRNRLAFARLKREVLARKLSEAEAEETNAQLALAIAQRAEKADTVRPPPPAGNTDAIDVGWEA